MAPQSKSQLPLRDGMFVILSLADSGSNALVRALREHPSIICHGNIFDPQRATGFFGTYKAKLANQPELEPSLRALRLSNPGAYLYKIAFDPQTRTHVGFNVEHEHFLSPMFAGARTIICRDQDIRVLMVHRRNLLRRYLSHLQAISSAKGSGESERPLTLNAVACLTDFQATQRRVSFVRRMLDTHPIFELAYEDFVGNEGRPWLDRVIEFLGVDTRALPERFRKPVAEVELSAAIANYAELKAGFSGTPYAEYFED